MDIEIKHGPSKRRLCLYTNNIGEILPLEYIENQTKNTVSGQLQKKNKNRIKEVKMPDNVTIGEVEKLLQKQREQLTLVDQPADFGKTLVYMGGAPYSPLMFIGEAPGGDEDYHGEPFVGLAGKKLQEIIEGGMRIPKEAVVITNLLKNRPPENRNPRPNEIAKYESFLKEQIKIISPKVIITLGKFATNWVLGKPQSTAIKASRGVVHTRDTGIKVIATYHPSYLIRQYSVQNRRAVLKDITMATEVLESMNLIPWW